MSLHERNRHQGRYNFAALTRACPELKAFVIPNPQGDSSIDFANPEAVKALNRALLKAYYQIDGWDLPAGYLCPPIPGRADVIHWLADLLAHFGDGSVPRGSSVRVLDIGVGANCIYPIIGVVEYGWSFVGSDVDPVALESARRILKANPQIAKSVELRTQKSPLQIFRGVITNQEHFDLTLCNPPFHASLEEAQAGARRKWNNLGRGMSSKAPQLNFGGQTVELCCEGGELGFIARMVEESVEFSSQCRWFSTLVSKEANLENVYDLIEDARADRCETLEMAQGQKISRLVAWSFS